MLEYGQLSLVPGQCQNLGLTLVSGRLKVTQADGSDLGTGKNAGRICVPSTTGGLWVVLDVTSPNHYFDDSAHTSDGDFDSDCEFGTSPTAAWETDHRPFALYAINTDNSSSGLYFGFSPSPTKTSGGSTNEIGYQEAIGSSKTDTAMVWMTATNVSALINKPAILIGSIDAKKNATNNWYFTALGSATGIGRFYPFRGGGFAYPTNQMTADVGTYFYSSNGSDAPTFSGTTQYIYTISLDGFVSVKFNFAGSPDGANATNLLITTPYKSVSNNGNWYGVTKFDINGVGSNLIAYLQLPSNSTQTYSVRDGVAVKNQDMNDTADEMAGSLIYKAF